MYGYEIFLNCDVIDVLYVYFTRWKYSNKYNHCNLYMVNFSDLDRPFFLLPRPEITRNEDVMMIVP